VISDEAVEAAAFNTIANLVTWSAWGHGTPDESAAKILEAITPMLKAGAWDEGYDAADHDASHSIKTGNPYRSQA
jgi:hypothetical protein